MLASSLFALAGLVSLSTAGYVLEDDYSGSNFFSMMDFFTDADPTHGYVTYVDQNTAQTNGLINTNNNQVYMGVDSKNVASGSGRQSVRVTSKKSYNHGLVILDLAHMPGSICGAWPAFWMVGPSWPNNGEVDIIEGVNTQSTNAMTLHTGAGCSISNNGGFSGSIATQNCDVNAAGQPTNAGCSIDTSNTQSYGDGFNAANGGVYATEWTSQAISIWFFPRSAIPSDINSGNPNPSNWGTPTASFSGSCNIDDHFKNQQIVFDTTFCGDWAGNVWTSDPVCSKKASTCQNFVQNNPSAFANAYWSVNSLKVYSSNGANTGSSSARPTTATRTNSVSVPVSRSSGVPSGTPWSFSAQGVATSSKTNSFNQGQGKHTRSVAAGGFYQAAAATSAGGTSQAGALPSTIVAAAAISSPTSPTGAGNATYVDAVATSIATTSDSPSPMAAAAGTGTDHVVYEAPLPTTTTASASATVNALNFKANTPTCTSGSVAVAAATPSATVKATSTNEWGNIEFTGDSPSKRNVHRHLVKHGKGGILKRWW